MLSFLSPFIRKETSPYTIYVMMIFVSVTLSYYVSHYDFDYDYDYD